VTHLHGRSAANSTPDAAGWQRAGLAACRLPITPRGRRTGKGERAGVLNHDRRDSMAVRVHGTTNRYHVRGYREHMLVIYTLRAWADVICCLPLYAVPYSSGDILLFCVVRAAPFCAGAASKKSCILATAVAGAAGCGRRPPFLDIRALRLSTHRASAAALLCRAVPEPDNRCTVARFIAGCAASASSRALHFQVRPATQWPRSAYGRAEPLFPRYLRCSRVSDASGLCRRASGVAALYSAGASYLQTIYSCASPTPPPTF